MASQKGRSRGSEKLEKLFGPPIITRQELADSLRVTKQSIWHWVQGVSRPSLDHCAELKRRFGIDPMDWTRAPRAKRRKRQEPPDEPAPEVEPDKPEPAPLSAWGDPW